MKIGIDLDGVLFDSEKLFRVYTELYDTNVLKRNSIIDNRIVRLQERYSWTQEEINDFMEKYQTKIVQEAQFMPGAREVVKMLKEEGHELIIITARGSIKKEHIQITQDVLKQANMDIFDKYYFGTENKEQICKQENIDIMIEDSNTKSKIISDNGIKTIYLKDAANFEMQENENLKVLYNWGEIYRYIKEVMNND